VALPLARHTRSARHHDHYTDNVVLRAGINLIVIDPISDRSLLLKANAYHLDIRLDIREIAKLIYPALVSFQWTGQSSVDTQSPLCA